MSPASAPIVELLYFDGCPGHERLLPAVERLAAEAGAELRVRPVETLEAAEAERFLGSPTVRVNGVDVDPGADRRDDFGLKCRIYRSDEGQSGVPPAAWIRAALDRAASLSGSLARVAGLVVTVTAPPDLRRRFESASAAEPLCALAPGARAELSDMLARVTDFGELPGKWQAALLRAEAARRGTPLPRAGGCCPGA